MMLFFSWNFLLLRSFFIHLEFTSSVFGGCISADSFGIVNKMHSLAGRMFFKHFCCCHLFDFSFDDFVGGSFLLREKLCIRVCRVRSSLLFNHILLLCSPCALVTHPHSTVFEIKICVFAVCVTERTLVRSTVVANIGSESMSSFVSFVYINNFSIFFKLL